MNPMRFQKKKKVTNSALTGSMIDWASYIGLPLVSDGSGDVSSGVHGHQPQRDHRGEDLQGPPATLGHGGPGEVRLSSRVH